MRTFEREAFALGFATLVTCGLSSPPFLPIGPADDEQGSVAASEKAGLARFPAAAHVIAPVTDLRTLFRSIVPALPGPIGHPARPQCISFARGDRCLVGVNRHRNGASAICPFIPGTPIAIVERTLKRFRKVPIGDMVRLLENEIEAANRGGLSCFYYGRAVSLTLRSAIMESGEFSPRDRPL